MMYDCGFSKENIRFRYRAGGLLIHDGRILFCKNAVGGYFYILGGGVHMGETSEHCIEREFLEETGIHAKAERLAVVCENFFVGERGEDCHTLEFYYLMTAAADAIEHCKSASDIGENLVWLPIQKIPECEIKPDFIKESIREIICGSEILHVVHESDRHLLNTEERMLGKLVTVTVDRPLGSYHPEYKDMYYPINYGYIKGIMAPDGEEQDAYILGVNEAVQEFTGRIIAIIHRADDVEEKWVVAPDGMIFTKDEIRDAVHFQEQYFRSEIVTESDLCIRHIMDHD